MRTRALPLIALACAITLAGCGQEPPATQPSAAPSEVTSEPSTPSPSAKARGGSKDIKAVQRTYATLAPESLFAKLVSCEPVGIEHGVRCSGPEVGDFQFFESHTKAASAAQVLTGLRSSRVLEDTGSKIVGWSILGNNAIATVIDLDRGLVMQQLVVVDDTDLDQHMRDLGLVSAESEASQPASSPHTAASLSDEAPANSEAGEAGNDQ